MKLAQRFTGSLRDSFPLKVYHNVNIDNPWLVNTSREVNFLPVEIDDNIRGGCNGDITRIGETKKDTIF